LLPIVKRDYKFNNYKLKTVSTFFLGETKDPLTAIDIFKAFSNRNSSPHGIEKLSECGKYCVQDGWLVLQLYHTLQLWIGLTEMANICHVPISYLFTKGQQIKIFSQVYQKCFRDHIMVESNVQHELLHRCQEYTGAFVFPPEPSLYDWVVPFDFSSLYPTIIIAYNIDYSTLVVDESTVDLRECHVLEWEDHVHCEHDPSSSTVRTNNNTTKKKTICQKYRYVFKKEPLGVIPALLQNLLQARADTRTQMKQLKYQDSLSSDMKKTLMTVYDKRQLAYKVSANSMYGGMGVQKGYLPFMPGAMSVTAMGRYNIQKAATFVQQKHQGRLIYGDSVVGETPITLKTPSSTTFQIHTIEELFSRLETEHGKYSYPEFKSHDTTLSCKEQVIPTEPLLVYADHGWTRIRRVIRHLTPKKIYRVITTTGIIDVTEDHSLISSNRQLKTPTSLSERESLLTYEYDTFWDQCTFPHDMIPLLHKIQIQKNGTIRTLFPWHTHTKECMLLFLFFQRRFPDLTIQIETSSSSLVFIPYVPTTSIRTPKGTTTTDERNQVLSIELLHTTTTQYVYDIETESGIFHAGIGNLIVKNTDSIYCHFKNHNDAFLTWKKAKEIESELIELFPKPMKLMFEEKIYKKFLILTKKRYMAYTCDQSGEIDSDLTIRGVLLARRDNCKWVRDVYELIVRAMMDGECELRIQHFIVDQILALFQWQPSSLKYFTITKLVNKCYKNKPLPIEEKKWKKRFEDLDLQPIPFPKDEKEVSRWNDYLMKEEEDASIPSKAIPRWLLSYMERSKPAHVQLAEKMKRRGHPVEAGSRIEYCIVTHPNDPKAKLYEKLEDPDYIMTNRDLLRLDRLYYLKLLQKPLDQLLDVVYRRKTFVQELYQLHLLKHKCMEELKTKYHYRPILLEGIDFESSTLSSSTTKTIHRQPLLLLKAIANTPSKSKPKIESEESKCKSKSKTKTKSKSMYDFYLQLQK